MAKTTAKTPLENATWKRQCKRTLKHLLAELYEVQNLNFNLVNRCRFAYLYNKCLCLIFWLSFN